MENFLYYPSAAARLRYFGNTLVKTAPLLMCSLSVLFAYKVGLFNIGAAGQYVVGAGASLYVALGLGMPWYVCLLAAIAAGAVLGAISGILKAYRNVNEVISCIMLNWISLYLVNALLTKVKETASPYTYTLESTNPDAIMPSLGLGALFSDNQYVTIALPLTVLVAVGIWVLLAKTKLGYELRATGCNKYAAQYCGMKEKRNIILTMAIAGGLAGMGAATLFLSGFEQWQTTQSAVPAMGFNGIAAAFLGGLNPIGGHLLLLLHPAHHQRRRLRGQDHVLRPDLRPDLRADHLSVRLRAVLQGVHERLAGPAGGKAPGQEGPSRR